jgi:hypothetical protein
MALTHSSAGPVVVASTHRWLVLVVVVAWLQLLPSAASTAADGCEARGTEHVPAAGPAFNDPTGSAADQHRILSAIVGNIAGAPPGSVIRIATMKIDIDEVLDTLVEAHDCGVGVRVLVPGKAWTQPGTLRLRAALGTEVDADSYIRSCRGSCTTAGSGGIMHVKSYLFSAVGDVRNVTMYSSSNLTQTQATRRWNDAYQIVANQAVHRSARRYFDKLALDQPTTFSAVDSSRGFRQYYFPSPSSFHLDILERTRCWSDDGPTSIDFSISIWKQVSVAERLADLHDAGCRVRVLLSLDKIDRAVLRTLLRERVPTRVQSMSAGENATHSKYIAIRGRHGGETVSTVYCGSSSVSYFSTHRANNNMLRRVDDQVAHTAYRTHQTRLWRLSRPLTQADVESARILHPRSAEAQF